MPQKSIIQVLIKNQAIMDSNYFSSGEITICPQIFIVISLCKKPIKILEFNRFKWAMKTFKFF